MFVCVASLKFYQRIKKAKINIVFGVLGVVSFWQMTLDTKTWHFFYLEQKKKETKSPIYPVSYLIPIYALFLPRLQHMDSWAFYPTVKNISLSLYYVWNKKEHCYNTLGWDVTSSIENGAEEIILFFSKLDYRNTESKAVLILWRWFV